MKHFYFLLILGYSILSCTNNNLEPKNQVEESEETFTPTSYDNTILLHKRYQIIVQTKYQNYIERGKSIYKMRLGIQGSGSSLGGDDKFIDTTEVNYLWRKTKSSKQKFEKIFPQDIAILEYYDSELNEDNITVDLETDCGDNRDNSCNYLPFLVFHVIDEDENNDKVFHKEQDSRSLYMFDLLTKRLTKINPPDIDVLTVMYIGSYKKKSDDYIILFRGYTDEDSHKYMYHVEEKALEKL
ncbi:MAG: hypothetical protein AAF518_11590 [Spirochaetota bacterium]